MSVLTFIEDGHKYLLDGQEIPSVTQILSGLSDFSMIAPDVMERKKQLGLAVHAAINLEFNDDLDESSVDPQCLPYVDAFRKFQAEKNFVVTLAEKPVHSLKYKFAGRLDLYGVMNGKMAQIDIKTVAAMSPATALQTAAYSAALEETSGHETQTRYGLQLRADGTYRLTPYTNRNDWNVFLAFLSCYNWKKRNGL